MATTSKKMMITDVFRQRCISGLEHCYTLYDS